ncbi:MAG: hypothetical protein EA405_03555 [Rhodospirillales bacterium]|nr:MAG: hypothetical protein EA405_03555 [Rhodospirillales bacterium]
MWWSRLRRLGATGAPALVAVLVLGACGFQPMHAPGTPASQKLAAGLADTEVGLIADRPGQMLREELRHQLGITRSEAPARYRVDVVLNETVSEVALQRTGLATRADLALTADMTLTDLATGSSVLRHRASTISSFNLAEARFSTLAAEEGARRRAILRLAHDIRLRLSAFFSGREAVASDGHTG